MSAGKFEATRYRSNNGINYAVRVQEETPNLVLGGQTNNPPTGAVHSRGF